jgi:hypothetical protein
MDRPTCAGPPQPPRALRPDRLAGVRRLAVGLSMLALLAGAPACGDGDAGERKRPTPAPSAARRPELPAALTATCRRLARDRVPVLCPPAPGAAASAPRDRRLEVVHEDLDPDPCTYIVNVQQPDHDAAGDRPSHVVLAGSCGRLPLTAAGARWPVDPLKSLRAVSTPPLQSGQTPDQVTLRRPLVLRRLAVRGQPGMLLRFDPRPPGGLHGGHVGLAWNEGGHGYLLSLHYETRRERRNPRPDEVAALLRFAASLRPMRP